MKKLKSKIEMRKELLRHLEEIEKLPIQRTFSRSSLVTPKARLGVIIAASVIKVQLLTEDLMASILDKKYFTSLSIMRMIFEEVILITFILSKLKKAKSLKDMNHILLRVSVGKVTKLGRQDELAPYNIHTTLDEAEEYITSQDSDLRGIFDDLYTFISDQVHPNAPSRYYFMKKYGDMIRITSRETNEKDIKMLLNNACMALGLFLLSIIQLMKIDIGSYE